MSMKSRVYEEELEVIANREIAEGIYELRLAVANSHLCKPGQFINIKLSDNYLRRPISISEIGACELTIVYKVVGRGTKKLATIKKGEKLDTIYPLGNGYELPQGEVEEVVIVGGGIGMAPQLAIYNYLRDNTNLKIKVVGAFRDETHAYYEEKFAGVKYLYDSRGDNIFANLTKGSYIYACGPHGLLVALAKEYEGQYLLEERMGCGFGACMGCSKKVAPGEYKRVCVEGPMFYREEVNYEA